MGGDCSLRTCPFGPSWYAYPTADEVAHFEIAECSDGGVCDRSAGTCTCSESYSGAACEYMPCPSSTTSPCNGHGRCISMAKAAIEAGYTYGLDTNLVETWDAHRIHGCACDDQYEGYDCSERTCPLGDDPGTYGQFNELQLLKCTAFSGEFTLTYLAETTGAIAFNASAAEVEAALETLHTIVDIDITFTSEDKACSADTDSVANIMKVQFKTEHGDLDAIVADNSAIYDENGNTGSFTVYTDGSGTNEDDAGEEYLSVQGTTESEPCSNRGLCDRTSGVCVCFAGYASSDGVGNEGVQRDCGHRVKQVTSQTS